MGRRMEAGARGGGKLLFEGDSEGIGLSTTVAVLNIQRQGLRTFK